MALTHHWFIGTQHRSSHFILFTFLLAFVVVLLGAYTRLTDAGLSCPDWPHCFGYITAPHTASQLQTAAVRFPHTTINIKKAWTEMTHRYFAGTEGILILIVAFSLLFKRHLTSSKSKLISLLLIALLAVQIMLGMLTVTAKLKPMIVLLHLLTGISLLCTLWWAYLTSASPMQLYQRHHARLLPWLWLAVVIVFMQITLGGWVSSHYAGLACIDLPFCNGQLLPTMNWQQFNTDLITIHMAHRIGAVMTGTYLVLLAMFLLSKPALKPYGMIILLLMALQFMLGVLNVVWLRPVFIALLHHGVALLLLLTTLTLLIKSHHSLRTYL